MAIKTYAARLEEVQTAIAAVLVNGQSYQIGERSFTKADLATLLQMEKVYTVGYNKEIRGGGIRVRGATLPG